MVQEEDFCRTMKNIGGAAMKLNGLLVLVLTLIVTVGCAAPTSTHEPAPTATAVSIPEYIAEVEKALDFIEETLEIVEAACNSVAEGEISKEEFAKIAAQAKRNLETSEDRINSMIPPPESAGPVSFEEVQENLLLGIKGYKRAFDEMIRYGEDGRLYHIDKATEEVEHFANPYIGLVKYHLVPWLKREFLE